MAKAYTTRKDVREQIAKNIKEIADFSDDGAIQCNVDLIREYLKKGELDKVEERLKSIEECCVINHSKTMQSFHAFEMMRHFALAIGEKYDPMY